MGDSLPKNLLLNSDQRTLPMGTSATTQSRNRNAFVIFVSFVPFVIAPKAP
jgi:hypothetical protein